MVVIHIAQLQFLWSKQTISTPKAEKEEIPWDSP